VSDETCPAMGIVPGTHVFPWWLVLIQGIVTLILGILFLYYPYGTLFVLVTFLGAYWFVSGIVGLIGLAADRTNWGWKVVFGILGIIAGIAILAYPYYSTIIVPAIFIILIGFWGLIMGFMGLFAAFKGGGWGAGIMGVLLIIFGFLVLLHPMLTVAVLPFILGAFGIIGGIAAIVGAFMLRSRVPEAPAPTP